MKLTDNQLWELTQYAFISMGGIVTVQSYQELIRGVFGKNMGVTVTHTKNLNRGDECCEVVVKKIRNTTEKQDRT